MSVFKVKVKWGKELYKDIEVNTNEDPLVFKAQLFALTGVQPDRQKIMVKGAALKEDSWENIKLSDNTTVLLMGTKDDLPQAPTLKPVFVEDMSETQLSSSLDLPGGIRNLGNTCYMNAVMQCLNSVPELRSALSKYEGVVSVSDQTAYSQSIAAAIRDLFKCMESGSSIAPVTLMHLLHLAVPRFAEKGTDGSSMQQDANECWTEVMRILQEKIPALPDPNANGDNVSEARRTFVDQFLGGSLEIEWKCSESDEELVTYQTENFLQLSCFISQDVKYMINGLKNKMQENITKHSAILNRDAEYVRKTRIRRLPAYLAVQFVRFFYKEKGKINAKILKDIKFPLEFDAYELCTKKLQEKLDPMRKRFKELEEAEIENSMSQEKVVKKDDKKTEESYKIEPYSFPDDVGSNNSGYYTLQAVLTHKGRSSSSGHYVAWVRYKQERWIKCDDDVITPVTAEDVLKLSGGGDWHCAYVLLYGPKLLKIPQVQHMDI